jgi:hypothetical protein
VPPHQQYPVLIIHYGGRSGPAHADDVLLELSAIRQAHRSDTQPDERVLINQALAEDLPLGRLRIAISHGHDATH